MLARLLVMLLGLLLGLGSGQLLSRYDYWNAGAGAVTNTIYLMIAGLLLGFLVAPRLEGLASTLFAGVSRWFGGLQPQRVAAATVGIIVALLVGVLLNSLLANAPFYTWYWSAFVTLALGVFFVYFAVQNDEAFANIAWNVAPQRRTNAKLLDTNVIIDGRIVDLARSGFLEGEVIVPAFVLRELQVLADHADAQRRTRGKRGLAVLEELREVIPLTVKEWNVPEMHTVDDKLVRFARELGAKLVTNDANLSKVAKLYGLQVLSIHEAAVALRPRLAAGEVLDVTITKAGQQQGQGVGYLDDGTMIVVEDGLRHKGKTMRVTVMSAVQTSVGRMVFARPETD